MSCQTCGEGFEQGSIITTCVCCLKLFHPTQTCTFTTSTEVNVLKLKNKEPLLMYRCSDCKKAGGISASLFESLSSLKDLGEKVSESCSKIDSVHKDFLQCVSDVKQIKVEVNSLKSVCSSLQSQVTKCCSIDSINAELQDRLARSNNLIIYGVDFSDKSQSDSLKVKSLLSNINNLNLDNISTRRLGKGINNKPPPTLVKLSSKYEVHIVLRNKNKLPPGISVSSDKTQMEREKLTSLIKIVNDHNSNNPTKKSIKYVKGVPTIVNNDPVNNA